MDAAERLKSLLANTLYLHQCFLDALNENEGVMDGTLLFSKIRRTVMPNSDQLLNIRIFANMAMTVGISFLLNNAPNNSFLSGMNSKYVMLIGLG